MKNTLLTVALATALTGAATGLSATELDTRWYVAPAVSWMSPDDDRSADDDIALSVSVGKALNERWNLDFRVFWDELDRDVSAGGGDIEQYGVGLDALMFWSRGPVYSPYLLLGINAINTEVANGGDETNPAVDFGLGFLRTINEQGMALRSEVRYRKDFDDDSVASKTHLNDWLFTVGLHMPFGAAPAVAPAEQAPPVQFVEVDFDDDGVEDSLDKCPNTPPGTTVDEFGCPLHVAPMPMVKAVIVLEGVNFEFDSAQLTATAKERLDRDATTLLEGTDDNAEIAGHTDSVGSDEYNEGLSQRRADSVKSYLVENGGIDEERLTTEGYGESQPIAGNDTADGRTSNRRVELRLLNE